MSALSRRRSDTAFAHEKQANDKKKKAPGKVFRRDARDTLPRQPALPPAPQSKQGRTIMLKTLTIAAIVLAAAAATAPAQAGLRGISVNGPSRAGIAINGPSRAGIALNGTQRHCIQSNGTSINGSAQASPVAPDASGMRVLTLRPPSGPALMRRRTGAPLPAPVLQIAPRSAI
jgi:hypothetical protein